jgi:hypothetical protein
VTFRLWGCLFFSYACFSAGIFQLDCLKHLLSKLDYSCLGLGVLAGESAVDVWIVLNVKLLTVQIKEASLQFSTPLYLPPGQKSAAYQDTSVAKVRRIWCEDCRVVQMQFKQKNGKWE